MSEINRKINTKEIERKVRELDVWARIKVGNGEVHVTTLSARMSILEVDIREALGNGANVSLEGDSLVTRDNE